MSQQLTAFDRRIRIFSGEFKSFDGESKDLFGIVAPIYPESHYVALLDSLNKILPGKGDVQSRFQNLANQFIIPKVKLDTVFRATIAEARKKTKISFKLLLGRSLRPLSGSLRGTLACESDCPMLCGLHKGNFGPWALPCAVKESWEPENASL